MSRRRAMPYRPEYFRLSSRSDLAQGLKAAYLSRFPGTFRYDDATESLWGGGNPGTLTGYTGAGNTPAEMWQWDGYLRRLVLRHNDAGTNYVACPKTVGNFANDFTASMWVYRSVNSTYAGFWKRTLSAAYQGSSASQHAFVKESATQLIYWYNAGSSVTFNYSMPLLQWRHYAVTHSADNVVSLYVDGVFISSGNAATLTLQPTYSLYVGDRNYGEQCLKGYECDFMLHSPALSADVIKQCADPTWSIDYGGLIQPAWRRVFEAATVEATTNRRRRLLCGV